MYQFLSVTPGLGISSDFDKNVAQLHDWLKLVEQKIKSLNISIGDEDDMTSTQQKQAVSYFFPIRSENISRTIKVKHSTFQLITRGLTEVYVYQKCLIFRNILIRF